MEDRAGDDDAVARGDREARYTDMQSALGGWSSLVSGIEDLVAITAMQVGNRGAVNAEAMDPLGPYLGGTGAEAGWIGEHIVTILDLLVEAEIFPSISLYVLRFLSTDAAQRVSSVRLSTAGPGSNNQESERDIKTLSVGSRLLIRTATFCQHLTGVLASVSKDLGLGTILVNALAGTSLAHDQEGGEQGPTLANNFQRMIDLRRSAEAIYWAGLNTTLMLYTGEEAPVVWRGSRRVTASTAFPRLFPHTKGAGAAAMGAPLPAPTIAAAPLHCRWSAHMSKLFEPILIEFVGEDGKGNRHMPIGADCLILADKLVDRLLIRADDAMISNGGVATRGALYFAQLLKLSRAFSVEDAAVNEKAKERSQG